MGSFDKLEIGRRSLYAAQMGQRTTGQNIANVNTEGYKRQSLEQSEFVPEKTGILNGVKVDGIKRAQDEYLEQKILAANADLQDESTRAEMLRNLEVIYNDRDGRGLSNMIAAHWAAWNELAVSPESLPLRQQLLERAKDMAVNFNTLHDQTRSLQKEISKDVQNDINDINIWAEDIASLNTKIVMFEAQGKSANGLKNDRDRLANLLSGKIDVQRSFNQNGKLHLQISNGHTLVDGDTAYKLQYKDSDDQSGKMSLILKLQDTSSIDITHFAKLGETGGKIKIANDYIQNVMDKLDNLADEIRFQVNKQYVVGTPLYEPFKEMNSAADIPEEYVNQRISQLSSGDVKFNITDDDGDTIDTVKIYINQEDTAQSIAAKINAAADDTNEKPTSEYLSAAFVGAKFNIKAKDNYRFYIAEDNTGAMAKLGINVFFSGNYGAGDISVNSELAKNSERIAAGEDMLPGNNQVALNIGNLVNATPMAQGTETFNEFYDTFITEMSLDLQTSKKRTELKKETYDQYDTMREEISGVNLDEEMANIIRYQRAYEASAKFTSAADEMLKTVINM